MQLILAFIGIIILGFIFWFLGHIIQEKLKIKEDNKLLLFIINISLGLSAFLLTVNFSSQIFQNFSYGVFIFFIGFAGVVFWQKEEFIKVYKFLQESYESKLLEKIIKENTDKYFWILLGSVNFLYVSVAFSSLKINHFEVGNSHVFNIRQLLNNIYPIKYAGFPDFSLRSHYGADILAGTLSKITGNHPELSLDILTILLVNIVFLIFYGLSIKFLNSNKINKYLIPFVGLLAWGPILQLFGKSNLQAGFYNKLYDLSQAYLTTSAIYTGCVFHWFFNLPSLLGALIFLVLLYFLHRFFSGEQDLNSKILLGILIGTLSIADFSKFIVIILGLLLYLLLITQIKIKDKNQEILLIKNVGFVFALGIFIGIINGNCFQFGKHFIPLQEIYKIGKSSFQGINDPLGSNLILILMFLIGFYKAYKLNHNWVFFLIPFFISALLLPYFILIPGSGAGEMMMTGNLLGAFAFPLAVDFLIQQTKIKETQKAYIGIFILFSFSTLLFWAFGDKPKPTFFVSNNKLKFSGIQVVTESMPGVNENLKDFVNYLKSKNVGNKSIVAEEEYNVIFTAHTGLTQIVDIKPIETLSNIPIKKEFLINDSASYNSLFSFNKEFCTNKKVNWIFLTQKAFRHFIPPHIRLRLLDSYINKGLTLSLTNKTKNLEELKELYSLNPNQLSLLLRENFPLNFGKLVKSLTSKKTNSLPDFIKEIIRTPYYGIYNSLSNDFDGDDIADFGFFDESKRAFYIVYGKNLEGEKIDLSKNILQDYNGKDLLIPVPSDYDGDLKTDIALFNKNTGIWRAIRSSDSTLDFRVETQRWCHPLGEVVTPADFDGDLKTDHSCFDSNQKGAWHIHQSTDGEYMGFNFPFSVLDIPVHVDIDGDKRADFVVYKPSKQYFDVYLSSNNFSRTKYLRVPIGDSHSVVVPSDYDGDGKCDLGTWSPISGDWEIAYASDILSSNLIEGTPQQFLGCGIQAQESDTEAPKCAKKIIAFGEAGQIPMPADYDGDGKSELAVYDVSTSKLKIKTSEEKVKIVNLSKYKTFVFANFIGL